MITNTLKSILYGPTLCSTLLLIAALTLPPVSVADAAVAPQKASINKPIKGSFGWRFGRTRYRDGLTIRVPYSKRDLLFRVQGYDIDGGEVSLFVNGKNLGNLLVSGKKAVNQTELWWIPESLQRRKGNIIKLVQNTPGSTWGVRRLGVFLTGSKRAQFGALRRIDGDTSNPDLVRVIIPKGSTANRLNVRYYGINHDSELRLYVGGRELPNPKRTRKDGWSSRRTINIPGNRSVLIDFYHHSNAQRSKKDQPWGVGLVSLTTADPGPVADGGSDNNTDGNGTDGNSTDGTGTDGNGTDGNGTDGNGTDGNGTDGNGTDGNGTDGNGTDGNGTDGNGTDGNGTDGNSTDGGTTDGGTSDGGTTDGGGPGGGSSLLGLPTISNAQWDKTAVRKVLHTFAYGGHPTEQQITTWAKMHPHAAIREMFTMDDHNTRLSPPSKDDRDNLTRIDHSLLELSKLWSSNRGENRTPANRRHEYKLGINQLQRVWFKSIMVRGLNPFRSKIAVWETNYHMAVNHDAGVYGKQLARYYDDVVDGLERNEPYSRIITRAARSAAIAEQYKHKFNVWQNDQCECNEDFAREYHQLFFGILGKANRHYHETTSIKNTAKMLTDMRLFWKPADVGYADEVAFGRNAHHAGNLEILGHNISGNDASEKIDALSAKAILHPESLDFLPIHIIRGLADDRLSGNKIALLRRAWKMMPQKNLLEYLHAYAVSSLFHDKTRIKYLNSLDRHALLSTRLVLNNEEAHSEYYLPIESGTRRENYVLFAPTHNVFGGQTGIEAARSTEVFRNNYNLMTRDQRLYTEPKPSRNFMTLKKNWSRVVPRSNDGSYKVRDVAEWLWNYTVADGLKNFGDLEKAQIYAFLTGPKSLQHLLDPNDKDRVISSREIRSSPAIQKILQGLGEQRIQLDSTNTNTRENAQIRIGSALSFIAATPFIFAQEGR